MRGETFSLTPGLSGRVALTHRLALTLSLSHPMGEGEGGKAACNSVTINEGP